MILVLLPEMFLYRLLCERSLVESDHIYEFKSRLIANLREVPPSKYTSTIISDAVCGSKIREFYEKNTDILKPGLTAGLALKHSSFDFLANARHNRALLKIYRKETREELRRQVEALCVSSPSVI